jgi:hypothetical protein
MRLTTGGDPRLFHCVVHGQRDLVERSGSPQRHSIRSALGERHGGRAGSQRLVVDGVEMYRYRNGRNTVVAFVRNGHTCVLAGYVHFASALPKLASWDGEGAIPF